MDLSPRSSLRSESPFSWCLPMKAVVTLSALGTSSWPPGRLAWLHVASQGLGICQRPWDSSRLCPFPSLSVIIILFLPFLLHWLPSSWTVLCKSHSRLLPPKCPSSQATLTWWPSAQQGTVQSPRLPGRWGQEKSKLTTLELRRNYPELVSPPTFQGDLFLSLAWIHYYILL